MSKSRAHAPGLTINVLCPLRFECNAMSRLLAGEGVHIECCGPGAQGIERWAKRTGTPRATFSHSQECENIAPLPAGAIVILAGLAGSLRDDLGAGEARIVDRVQSVSGEIWRAPLAELGHPAGATAANQETIITMHDAVVASPAERRSLAQRTGADLVDMESEAFARLATQHGWRWGIVRGVSDDPSTSLPPRMERWVHPDGRTRWLAVLGAIARNPRQLSALRTMQRNATRAMHETASLIRALLQDIAEKMADETRNLTGRTP